MHGLLAGMLLVGDLVNGEARPEGSKCVSLKKTIVPYPNRVHMTVSH